MMHLDDQIQQHKEYNEKEHKSLIKKFIQNKKEQGAKISDIVVGTGLSIDWVEYTLRKLLNDYPAHLETDENGELLYFFDFKIKTKSLKEKITQVFFSFLKALWSLFVWIFKAWIVLMLFSYLFLNALIIAVTASVLTRNGDLVGWFIKLFFEVFQEIADFLRQKQSIGALHQVFSFVFGEKYTERDNLFLEKIILAFIHENEGKILSSDVVKMTGWDLRKAEKEMAHLLANYQGDVKVTEDGLIVYYFEDLKTAKVEKPVEKYEVWHRPLPTPHLNYNNTMANKRIVFINTFNLTAPLISSSIIAWYFEFGYFWNLPPTLFFWLFTFPVVFSVIFFLVPVLRYPFILKQQKEVLLINQSIRFTKLIFDNLSEKIYPKEHLYSLSEKAKGISKEQTLELLEKFLLSQEGEVFSDEKGVFYTFSRLKNEDEFSKL